VNSDLFVTGTDTGIGKTLLSSLLVAALIGNIGSQFKPVRAKARTAKL